MACEGPAKARFPHWGSGDPSRPTSHPAAKSKGARPYMAHVRAALQPWRV